MSSRRLRLASVAIATLVLAGCQPSPSPTRPLTTARPSPTVNLTAKDAALPVLKQLLAASGQRRLIKVELTQTTAQIVVVAHGTAHTWAWRDGKAQEVDGDTQYVGQASFTLDEFDLSDVKAIFARAAAISGSSSQQQLQIVEYYDGEVYMTVGTSPESATVFFRADGEPIPTLDYTTLAGLTRGLADASLGIRQAQQVGFDRETGVWVDESAGQAGTRRVVRPSRFPARGDRLTIKRTWPTFSPSRVQPDAVFRVLAQLDPTGTHKVRVEIDRRDGLSDPTITFVVDGRTLVTDLAGNDISAQVTR